MIILAGLGSFFVGSAMQTAMPSIASTTTGISSGTAYGVLLFANGLGGVLGGLLLEGTGWIKLTVRAALWSTVVYGASTVFFALSHDYLSPPAARRRRHRQPRRPVHHPDRRAAARPAEKKGQVIGVYGVGANGMRIGSGITVGFSAPLSAFAPPSAGHPPRSAPASPSSRSTSPSPPAAPPPPPPRSQTRRGVTG